MEDIKKFKSDDDDLMDWVNQYADIRRCAGDRIVHRMYCCLHCGSCDPTEECLSPKPEQKR